MGTKAAGVKVSNFLVYNHFHTTNAASGQGSGDTSQLWGFCSCSAKTFFSQELDSAQGGTLPCRPFLLSEICHIIADNFGGIKIKLSRLTHKVLSGG